MRTVREKATLKSSQSLSAFQRVEAESELATYMFSNSALSKPNICKACFAASDAASGAFDNMANMLAETRDRLPVLTLCEQAPT
jgi:hypothetical protein